MTIGGVMSQQKLAKTEDLKPNGQKGELHHFPVPRQNMAIVPIGCQRCVNKEEGRAYDYFGV